MTDLDKAKARFNEDVRGYDTFDEMIADARECQARQPLTEDQYINLMSQFADWPVNELKAMWAEIVAPAQ